MATQYFEGVGRRKTSTARVRVTLTAGGVTVNGKPAEENYFTRDGRPSKRLLAATRGRPRGAGDGRRGQRCRAAV